MVQDEIAISLIRLGGRMAILTKDTKATIIGQNEAFNESALRTIGLSYKEISGDENLHIDDASLVIIRELWVLSAAKRGPREDSTHQRQSFMPSRPTWPRYRYDAA